jgi:hypothetical protein
MSATQFHYSSQQFVDLLGQAISHNNTFTKYKIDKLFIVPDNQILRDIRESDNPTTMYGFIQSSDRNVFARSREGRYQDMMLGIHFDSGLKFYHNIDRFSNHSFNSYTECYTNVMNTLNNLNLFRAEENFADITHYANIISHMLIAMSWARLQVTRPLLRFFSNNHGTDTPFHYLVRQTSFLSHNEGIFITKAGLDEIIGVEYLPGVSCISGTFRLEEVTQNNAARILDFCTDDLSRTIPVLYTNGDYPSFHTFFLDINLASNDYSRSRPIFLNSVHSGRLDALLNDFDLELLVAFDQPYVEDTNLVPVDSFYNAGRGMQNMSAPLSKIESYINMVFCVLSQRYVPKSSAVGFSAIDKDGDATTIYFNRQDIFNQLAEHVFWVCDNCGSRSYNQSDTFYEVIEDFTDLIDYLNNNYQDTSDIVDELHSWIQSRQDEEGPEDDRYCRNCGMGDDSNHYDRFFTLDTDRLNNVLAPFNKELATARFYSDTGYFVRDKDSDTTIDFNNLSDDYFVNDYSYRPDTLDFIVAKNEEQKSNLLYMGLEWEMDDGGTNNMLSFAINSALSKNKKQSWTMSDGSLSDGIEIATMPATLQAHMTEFDYDTACTLASSLGYRGHDVGTAGIHVHMNRRFFGNDAKIQMYKGALMALVLERNWDDFVKFSRRRYSRIEQWANKKDFLQALPANPTADDYQDTFAKKYGQDKYVALNTNNRSTFELRIFKSTLKANTIKATLQLVSNLAEWVKSHDLADAQSVSFDDIINHKQYKELTEYWQVAKERGIE